jgi:glycosyltransferase involved in cell wall biosynthesis
LTATIAAKAPRAAQRPVLFVTNHVPPDRAGAFRALHERVGIELALFGGRSHHATAGVEDPGVPHRHVAQREAYTLAASARYRAVVCGTAGRVALPAAWRGARRSGVPFVLWSALWSHPRTPAHVLAGAPLLRAIYRDADAVVAYGPHVAEFARRRGARRVEIAPQAVDRDFWAAPDVLPRRPDGAAFVALHVGRAARYKGVPELLEAWRKSGIGHEDGALVLVGEGEMPDGDGRDGVHVAGPQQAVAVRRLYAGASVLVMPAIATRSFREAWGLVANEAMHRGLPVIATDAVGAAAGGLVRHERNGLVVPSADAGALAAALRRVHDDAQLRDRLGAAAAADVAPYTFDAWADGFARALSLT